MQSLQRMALFLVLVVKPLAPRAAVAALVTSIAIALLHPGPLSPPVGYAGGEATCGGGVPPSEFVSATGSSAAGTLSQTNPATGASTAIGPVTAGGLPLSLTGLAQQISTSTTTPGTLYGATGESSPNNPSSLVTINPATGQATVIGQFHTSGGTVHGMADIVFAPPNSPCAGTLLGVSGDNRILYSIDPATALITQRIAAAITGSNQGNGLTFDAAGNLWLASLDTSSLVRIDCAT